MTSGNVPDNRKAWLGNIPWYPHKGIIWHKIIVINVMPSQFTLSNLLMSLDSNLLHIHLDCNVKGTVSFGTWTLVFLLWKEFTPTWNLEFRFSLRGVLLDFQTVFEFAFARPIMLFLSCLVKNGLDIVSLWYANYSHEKISNGQVRQLTVFL